MLFTGYNNGENFILVTAFTIGHSITLALVSFDLFNISSSFIKFLIPVTIFITALNNVIGSNFKGESVNMSKNYLWHFFGLIHGMDF